VRKTSSQPPDLTCAVLRNPTKCPYCPARLQAFCRSSRRAVAFFAPVVPMRPNAARLGKQVSSAVTHVVLRNTGQRGYLENSALKKECRRTPRTCRDGAQAVIRSTRRSVLPRTASVAYFGFRPVCLACCFRWRRPSCSIQSMTVPNGGSLRGE
jgi:hypothetical protein